MKRALISPNGSVSCRGRCQRTFHHLDHRSKVVRLVGLLQFALQALLLGHQSLVAVAEDIADVGDELRGQREDQLLLHLTGQPAVLAERAQLQQLALEERVVVDILLGVELCAAH